MPTYNFLCTSKECSHEHQEFFLSYSSTPKSKECPKCSQEALKAPSRPLVLFDGSNPDFLHAHSRWVKHHEQQGNGVRTE